jgi:hypothetical protein
MRDNVSELDTSFFNNLKAVLFKRYSNYRRNKKAIFNEAVVPALIMIAGLGLTKIERNWQSESVIQSPARLPLPQALLVNPQPVIAGDVKIVDLVNYLPDRDSFNVKYSAWNNTSSAKTTFDNYEEQVFEFG